METSGPHRDMWPARHELLSRHLLIPGPPGSVDWEIGRAYAYFKIILIYLDTFQLDLNVTLSLGSEYRGQLVSCKE